MRFWLSYYTVANAIARIFSYQAQIKPIVYEISHHILFTIYIGHKFYLRFFLRLPILCNISDNYLRLKNNKKYRHFYNIDSFHLKYSRNIPYKSKKMMESNPYN